MRSPVWPRAGRLSVNWRLFRGVAGLVVLTLSAVALGVAFLIDRVPDTAKAERERIKAGYRTYAANLRQSPESGREIGKLPREWKAAGKMAPGKWGFEPLEDGANVRVWYDDGRKTRSVDVARIEGTASDVLLLAFGCFLLLTLVLVTFAAVRIFVRYAKERDDFVAATVHDLTTPLVGMRFAIGRDDETARRLNARMIRLVANLKDFMQLGGRRPAPNKDRFDLRKAYAEAYDLFAEDYRDLFEGKDVAVDAAEGPLLVEADEMMTIQVLWNLLGNDLKYAAPYGKVSVTFRKTVSDRHSDRPLVAVDFVDEGKGMSPQEMRRAFDRYYRARTVLTSGKGGFGIGLCTAREFARAMGGDLTVRANHPTGCVFTLVLPSAEI